MQIKVFIADDHQLFIEGVKALIRDNSDVTLIGEAENGADLLEQLKTKKPDVILIDINMPVMNGIEATKKIREQYPDIRVLALTMFDDTAHVSEIMKAGASGYLLKNTGKAELIGAITKVYGGEKYVSSDMSVKIVEQMMNNKESSDRGVERARKADITKRELEIIKLVAQELTNAEIAAKLNNSPMTIITHRKNLLRKLGVKNTAGLIKYAMQHGLLDE